MSLQRIIIRDIRNRTQSSYEVSPQMTVDELIHKMDPHPTFGLSYQNIILETNRPLSYYNFENDTLLYVCPTPRTNMISQILPEFAELSQSGDLLIPFIENLINQNAEVLEALQTNGRPLNFRISIRSNQNGQPTTRTFQVQRQSSTHTSVPGTQVSTRVQQTPNRTQMNVQRHDTQPRQNLNQLLNNEIFRTVIRRSQQEHYEERYDVEYNTAMAFVQSWLNVTSQNLSRTQTVFNAFINLLNNPRIVLSSNTFNQVTSLMRTLADYLNHTASVMENEFSQRQNEYSRRVPNEQVGNEYLRSEVINHEEELLWNAFEETLTEEARLNEIRVMENSINEINTLNNYIIRNNENEILINEDTPLEQISMIIDQLK
ncbi:hypothetical protein EDI_183780 [Entamoeba dispar SAW760]|uniref:Ubiquitin-like domain-containing protein n=1 Tax=Entamoeba dispar (strain ATCC PRA-260 / SAW760) TaxID=370354 RepID=B0E6Q7_ENTDS|nr:uncharacterized protein EDI_183780 [Entamoeba dispar SAW760]EDR29789.1 hypothetical protein EDI_183780 [Entamoeba dispar SAW760]|eukprot:EDR29789.1 hypothetical protein EDI_183780 [Entamoeba dispar SAW760]